MFQQQRKFSFTFSLNRFLSTSADTNFLQCADCTRGEQCGSHLGGAVWRGARCGNVSAAVRLRRSAGGRGGFEGPASGYLEHVPTALARAGRAILPERTRPPEVLSTVLRIQRTSLWTAGMQGCGRACGARRRLCCECSERVRPGCRTAPFPSGAVLQPRRVSGPAVRTPAGLRDRTQ